MSEEIKEQGCLAAEDEIAAQVNEEPVAVEETAETEETAAESKPKFDKKKLAIIGAAAVVVIVIAIILMIPSKFKRVKNECVQIAGMVSSGKDYFTIDTYPDVYENMDETVRSLLLPGAQSNAIEAIQYANEELGFNGSVYDKMLKTSALMGRQSEETNKYKVSWTYHPDDGLEVTYEKK